MRCQLNITNIFIFSLQLHSLCASGPFPPPALREQSAGLSVAVAAEYTRAVRQVEGHLRRQAGRITEEATRLDHQKEKLEKLLRSVRTALLINQKTTDERTRRPATETVSETGWVAKILLCYRIWYVLSKNVAKNHLLSQGEAI